MANACLLDVTIVEYQQEQDRRYVGKQEQF